MDRVSPSDFLASRWDVDISFNPVNRVCVEPKSTSVKGLSPDILESF